MSLQFSSIKGVRLAGSQDILLEQLGKEELGWDPAQYTQCNVCLLVSTGTTGNPTNILGETAYNKLIHIVEFAVLGFNLDETLRVRVKCPYNLNTNVSSEICMS